MSETWSKEDDEWSIASTSCHRGASRTGITEEIVPVREGLQCVKDKLRAKLEKQMDGIIGRHRTQGLECCA